MYFIPQTYVCPKCDFDMKYTQSSTYAFLPISENGRPFCYKCLINFITENVPVMKLQQDE